MSLETAFVPLGGSSVVGTLGYVSAARELAEQVARGEMPEPDLIVTALGSGGTVAGLAVGLEASGLRTRVLAVAVSSPAAMHAAMMRNLVKRASKRVPGVDPKRAIARVTVDAERIGAGYGHATRAGDEATVVALAQGLVLDPTYTAKSFAGLLAERDARERKEERSTLLFLHTLSSVPLDGLLERAPSRVDAALAPLLLPS
jgi:D-cysteine desulfhydrase